MGALQELDNLLSELHVLVNAPATGDANQILMLCDLLVSTIRESLTNIAKSQGGYQDHMRDRLGALYTLTEECDQVINVWKNPAPARVAILSHKLRSFKVEVS